MSTQLKNSKARCQSLQYEERVPVTVSESKWGSSGRGGFGGLGSDVVENGCVAEELRRRVVRVVRRRRRKLLVLRHLEVRKDSIFFVVFLSLNFQGEGLVRNCKDRKPQNSDLGSRP